MSGRGTFGWKGSGDRALEFPAGDRVTESPTGRGRIRYNRSLARFEGSVEGETYTPFGATTLVATGRTAWVDSVNGSDATGAAGNLARPFASVAAALTAAAALVPAVSVTAPASVQVLPGQYTEAPLTVPAFTSLVGVGGPCCSRIVASALTAALVTVAPNGQVENLSISGASGVGGIGVSVAVAGGNAAISHCQVSGCETGVRASGAGVVLLANDVTVTSCTTGWLAQSAGTIVANILTAVAGSSSMTTGVHATGAGSHIAAHNLHIDSCSGDGARSSDTATTHLFIGRINACTNGIRIPSTGGRVELFAVDVLNSVTFDLLIETSSATLFTSGVVYDSSKLSISSGATVLGSHINTQDGDESFAVEGELHVGTFQRPAEAAIGGGDSHVVGLVSKRNTNLEVGAWTDITAAIRSASGSTVALFDAVGVGSTWYIGGDLPFPGLKVNLDTALALGAGTIVVEFWNGAAWVVFDFMTTDSDPPYAQYGNALWQLTTSVQMRFGAMTGWATKALDGSIKYWMRVRVSVAITTIPVAEQMKLHTSRTEINADGFLEFFGAARPVRNLLIHRNLLDDQVGSSPANASVLVSANISLGAKDNQFNSNALDARAAMIQAPVGLDTSMPVTVTLFWQTVGVAGDLQWFLYDALARVGDVVAGAIADSVQNTILTVPGVADVMVATAFSVDIETLLAGDFLTLKIERDARAGNLNDTLGSNVTLIQATVTGTFWR